jgi:ComF family protein
MGTWLADLYRDLMWQATLVVPVPLANDRRRHRGYNQCALVASALAGAIGVPHDEEALLRTRETRSQVGLDPEDRSSNVRGAFEARAQIVRGRTVLIVDDLWTTGATLMSCAEALLAKEVDQVFGLTVARARGAGDGSLNRRSRHVRKG